MTLLQKKKMCGEKTRRQRAGETTSHATIAKWSRAKLHLGEAPSKSTISRILSKLANLLPRSNQGISKNQGQEGKTHGVKEALFEWVCNQYAAIKDINGEFIRQKAINLHVLANDQLDIVERTNSLFSEGWIGLNAVGAFVFSGRMVILETRTLRQ